jgi:hypothetical protein
VISAGIVAVLPFLRPVGATTGSGPVSSPVPGAASGSRTSVVGAASRTGAAFAGPEVVGFTPDGCGCASAACAERSRRRARGGGLRSQAVSSAVSVTPIRGVDPVRARCSFNDGLVQDSGEAAGVPQPIRGGSDRRVTLPKQASTLSDRARLRSTVRSVHAPASRFPHGNSTNSRSMNKR